MANDAEHIPVAARRMNVCSETTRTFSAPALKIGGITIRGMRVTFGDMYIFDAWKMTDEPALLIGMDIIGLLDSLIIDYKRETLHLRAELISVRAECHTSHCSD